MLVTRVLSMKRTLGLVALSFARRCEQDLCVDGINFEVT